MSSFWLFILIILLVSILTGFIAIWLPVAVAIYLAVLVWKALMRRSLRDDD